MEKTICIGKYYQNTSCKYFFLCKYLFFHTYHNMIQMYFECSYLVLFSCNQNLLYYVSLRFILKVFQYFNKQFLNDAIYKYSSVFSYLHVCSTSFTAQFSLWFRYRVFFFSQQFHNHLAWLRLCLCEPFFSSKSKEKVFGEPLQNGCSFSFLKCCNVTF